MHHFPYPKRHWLAVVCAGLLFTSGCSPASSSARATYATPEAEAEVGRLLELMHQRLLIMHDVARWKWNARAPIADPAREQAILEAIVVRSRNHTIDPALARAFFQAQFAAAKQVQEDDFRRWEANRAVTFPDVPDLITQLRPRIDAINDQMLAALATVGPFLDDPKVQRYLAQQNREILRGDGITEPIRDSATEPLKVSRR
jgi:chorismate mutase